MEKDNNPNIEGNRCNCIFLFLHKHNIIDDSFNFDDN